MTKPILVRLKRLESAVLAMATAGTQSLRKIVNVTLMLRTTIVGAQTFNLPAATGKGGLYRIFIGITATGNKIVKAAGTDLIQGQASIASAGTSGTFASASNTNTITLNGSTTGGLIGTMVELWDVAPGVWATQVNAVGSGVAATCFSNT
jgi:hypothetical protein